MASLRQYRGAEYGTTEEEEKEEGNEEIDSGDLRALRD